MLRRTARSAVAQQEVVMLRFLLRKCKWVTDEVWFVDMRKCQRGVSRRCLWLKSSQRYGRRSFDLGIILGGDTSCSG